MNFTKHISLTMLFSLSVLSTPGSQIVVNSNNPFDTLIIFNKNTVSQNLSIIRYNLHLTYSIAITTVLPPTPFSEGLYTYATLNKMKDFKALKRFPKNGNFIYGILCHGFQPSISNPTCKATFEVDTLHYCFIDNIKEANDTLFIYHRKVWLELTNTTHYPVPDSILLRFEYKPGTPLSAKPHNNIIFNNKAKLEFLCKDIYTIHGVRIHPQKAISGVYINSNGRFLRLSDNKHNLE